MSDRTDRFTQYEARTTFIRIYSYERRNPKGILSNPFYAEDQPFDGLIQLLNLIENILNALGFPRRDTEQRVFDQMEKQFIKQQPVHAEAACGKPLASFQVSILFRQKASWHGSNR